MKSPPPAPAPGRPQSRCDGPVRQHAPVGRESLIQKCSALCSSTTANAVSYHDIHSSSGPPSRDGDRAWHLTCPWQGSRGFGTASAAADRGAKFTAPSWKRKLAHGNPGSGAGPPASPTWCTPNPRSGRKCGTWSGAGGRKATLIFLMSSLITLPSQKRMMYTDFATFFVFTKTSLSFSGTSNGAVKMKDLPFVTRKINFVRRSISVLSTTPAIF